jgi:predicted amidophosphoribosyltransferase
MPFQRTKIFKCGNYHPFNIQGQKNPNCDQVSRLMMDFKDPTNRNYQNAVGHFTKLIIAHLPRITYGKVPIIGYDFIVTVAPSHSKDGTSDALNAVARKVCQNFPRWTYTQVLRRHTTVLSSHKQGGNRNLATHIQSMEVTLPAIVQGTRVLVIDDVTTSGSTLTACHQLLMGAKTLDTIAIALLETTY